MGLAFLGALFVFHEWQRASAHDSDALLADTAASHVPTGYADGSGARPAGSAGATEGADDPAGPGDDLTSVGWRPGSLAPEAPVDIPSGAEPELEEAADARGDQPSDDASMSPGVPFFPDGEGVDLEAYAWPAGGFSGRFPAAGLAAASAHGSEFPPPAGGGPGGGAAAAGGGSGPGSGPGDAGTPPAPPGGDDSDRGGPPTGDPPGKPPTGTPEGDPPAVDPPGGGHPPRDDPPAEHPPAGTKPGDEAGDDLPCCGVPPVVPPVVPPTFDVPPIDGPGTPAKDVPEPGAVALMVLGCAAIALRRKQRGRA